MKSSLVANTIETIFKSIDRAVKFVDVKIPLFMHETVYETWNNNGKIDFKETNHDFVNYFGSRTKSTNEFIDCPISLIVGTPYLPPLAFMERAYRSHWKSNEEIETESESKKNRSTYPVPRSVSDRCAKGEVVQMTSRTPCGPDSPKVIVLLTDLDIQDDCQKQNGATIKKYKIRNKTDKAIFFDDFIKFIRNALRPHIIRKILNGGYEGKKIVDVCREFSHETDDLFSESQIRRIIEDNFKIETRFIEKSGKKIKTAYIESITEEGQSLAYPIK